VRSGCDTIHSTDGDIMLTDLTIKIVHDNYPYTDAMRTAWGASVLVTGPEKNVLFDTGSDGSLLLENMATLHIEPESIDLVVLSHIHPDHTGGLSGLLERNARVHVCLPAAFPARFKEVVQGRGATIGEVTDPRELCPDVFTTGLLGRRIREQALVVRTERGLVVLTGCAHYGVRKMVEWVKDAHGHDLLLVLGGFHLEWAMKRDIEKMIDVFQRLGVRYVAPTHCSGDKARQLFQQRYGTHYIEAGVGRTITLADLR
jgi:7,8-dihydropterin-6-yl-methyl-4-(beta-D-ribofuranosyl)aminobenzene 5'-phosphate synthase